MGAKEDQREEREGQSSSSLLSTKLLASVHKTLITKINRSHGLFFLFIQQISENAKKCENKITFLLCPLQHEGNAPRWLSDDSLNTAFLRLNIIPVHLLFPESICQHVHSGGLKLYCGHSSGHCRVWVCRYVHWCVHVHFQAGNVAGQNEPHLWWLVSVQAGLELLGEPGPQPLAGVVCGRSPAMGGETLGTEIPRVYTKHWIVYILKCTILYVEA